MRARTVLPIGIVVLTACTDLPPATAPAHEAPSFSSGASHVEDTFFATAMCAPAIGYNIRFGGPRVLVRHVTGTRDTTFMFRTHAFQGWRLPETVFDGTTVDFSVRGGAEMFNIKRAEDGTLEVRIHEGTLIFQSISGDDMVIARHVIRTVPGQSVTMNQWNCRLQP